MDLKKLIEMKKDSKPLDPMKKDAKMSMLKALRNEMSGLIKGELSDPSIKKVEVASNDAEGLAKGLEKAKELVSSDDDMGDFEHHSEEDESQEDESLESPEDEASEDEQLSDEDMAQLEMLLAKAKRMKGK